MKSEIRIFGPFFPAFSPVPTSVVSRDVRVKCSSSCLKKAPPPSWLDHLSDFDFHLIRILSFQDWRRRLRYWRTSFHQDRIQYSPMSTGESAPSATAVNSARPDGRGRGLTGATDLGPFSDDSDLIAFFFPFRALLSRYRKVAHMTSPTHPD